MCRFLPGVIAAIMLVPCSADESVSVELRYRSYRNWSIQLPQEQWFPVNDAIKVPHANGTGFPVQYHGNDLKFDTDGDGETDRTIKPLVDAKTNVSTTRVVLSGKTPAGKPFRYAVRIRNDANGWEWAPGGALAGTISTPAGPIPLRIIDQNGNGRFNDVGSDAMIVGTGDHAMLLSKTIFAGDHLQTVDYADNGTAVTLTGYDGPTARIDMSTSFNSKAVLLSSVIVSEDRQHSFDVGAIDGSVKVPAGTYTIVGGQLGLGNHRVQISAGRMAPLELTAARATQFNWGGPVESEFQFTRLGSKVQFSPDHIWYYGKAGEQYTGWHPVGKSPEFKVLDANTGVVLEVAILPGSC
ncbi:MAG: hypothetical protein GY758_17380 [Fuerstiella sp.]|jgi:hypothetical protein|nr:hypothetical protein [Fuerstiella sp.]MCP4510392.1 hypothetical protein [Fuerstiella sp.]MDG2130694.1 hypothetical protein [Fuerstiella sp.]